MKRLVLVVLASVGAANPSGRADSIWDRHDLRYANLFQDVRARQIGDVLTILISETTTATQQDQRTLSKTTGSTASVQFGVAGTGGAASPLFTESSSRQFNGNAQLSINQVFTDQIGVVVVDKLPNGNLVVEGYRSRVVAGEERVLRITGIVRPAYITISNSIASNQVANFRISYLGRGPTSRFANQNLLGRVMNLAWPW